MESLVNFLNEISWWISVIIAVPISIKVFGWIKSNFIFFGREGLATMGGWFLATLVIISMVIHSPMSLVLDKLKDISKPSYVRYIEKAKSSTDLKESMNYIKKSLDSKYNDTAVDLCKDELSMVARNHEDYKVTWQTLFEIVKKSLNKDDRDRIESSLNGISNMVSADEALSSGDIKSASEYLDKVPEDNRNLSEYKDIKKGIQEKKEYDDYTNSQEKLDEANAAKEKELNNLRDIQSEIGYGVDQTVEDSEIAFNRWDNALNEIYSILKNRLSTSEMDSLKQNQRNWIKERDIEADRSSLKSDGTRDQLKYNQSLANSTRDRCYELVENYIK